MAVTEAADPEQTTTYEVANLLYYFWLPSGKDEFGFEAYDDAPLRPTTDYRQAFERTIARHLEAQEKRLKGNHASLAGLTWRGSLRPQDAELGLRKIEFSFDYEPDRTHLPDYIAAGPLSGTAIIMSNGLHLWVFKIHYEAGTDETDMRESLNTFLREDFVQRYIDRLLGFGWSNADLNDAQQNYDGILTYYQLDLLFNCVFDAEAHPHLFLYGDREKEDVRRANDMYSIGSIVRSLSLSGFKENYEPLWDLRKNYSFRGASYGGKDPHIDTDIDLVNRPKRVDTAQEDAEQRRAREDAEKEREKLLSRLSFAAMEQFLRIAVPFGVTQYKAGLDHCRAELVNYSLLARRNHISSELRRPSLKGAAGTLSEVEAYHALIAGKVPSLEFVHGLVGGLSDVSAPLLAPREFEASNSWIEWSYSKSTFKEALDQFERYIGVIKTELAVIENSLAITRTDTMLSELADTRKLAEMETEDPHRSVTIAGGEWDNLSFRLAEFAIILGIFEVYSNIGIWFTDGLFNGSLMPEGTPGWYKFWGIVHWLPLVVAAVALLVVLLRRRNVSPRSVRDAASKKPESHIFDYAFMREKVNSKGLSKGVVGQLKEDMIDLQDPKKSAPPAAFSMFSEIPIGGVERVKYSLETKPNERGVYYLLHIEVDRRIGAGGDAVSEEAKRTELLRNVRLVARVPRAVAFDVEQSVRPVIGNCVRDLILTGKRDHEVRAFFESHFGWDWP